MSLTVQNGTSVWCCATTLKVKVQKKKRPFVYYSLRIYFSIAHNNHFPSKQNSGDATLQLGEPTLSDYTFNYSPGGDGSYRHLSLKHHNLCTHPHF